MKMLCSSEEYYAGAYGLYLVISGVQIS